MQGRNLKLILMGTGPFAVPSFEALRASRHDIGLVVTRPLAATKSRGGPPPSPVRQWADRHGLPIFDPHSINDPESILRLRQQAAELLVVCDYGQILKPEALATTRLGGINLHGSLLPRYRGAAPVQWALLRGETTTGVTVIHMTPRLDGGPVLAVRQTEIEDTETAGELEARLAEIGVAPTLEAVERLLDWDGQSPLGQIQDAAAATAAPRLKKSDGQIDWHRPASEIDCHVRGMQPWPMAFTYFPAATADKPPLRLAVKSIAVLEEPAGDRPPGQVIARDLQDGFRVATADRLIRIERLQPAGRTEMSGAEFIRGRNLSGAVQLG